LIEADQYPAAPESAYGWSKLMGEYETLLLEKEFHIPVSVLTLHNVYGPPSDHNPKSSQVVPALIHKAITYPKNEFVVWGSGRQGRAFVYVDDAVDALIAAMQKGLGQGVIQIGPNFCTSIKEVAEAIVDISGKDIPIAFDTSKPEGDEWRYADYAKARRLLGWTPKTSLRDGLELLYRWIQQDMAQETDKRASNELGII
jgi:nucleoside-diphosphate-sugar epimerase